ncbi:hypothetical protein BKA66DRAFT_576585 [Pyrenochaeta sp. MPI-SDFR-AT-0127]|nr:hypothetical protein BKA66DRAFT_576585 [Pyrenochaeta sp. MPI-SDFR-AT-0127]
MAHAVIPGGDYYGYQSKSAAASLSPSSLMLWGVGASLIGIIIACLIDIVSDTPTDVPDQEKSYTPGKTSLDMNTKCFKDALGKVVLRCITSAVDTANGIYRSVTANDKGLIKHDIYTKVRIEFQSWCRRAAGLPQVSPQINKVQGPNASLHLADAYVFSPESAYTWKAEEIFEPEVVEQILQATPKCFERGGLPRAQGSYAEGAR